MMAKLQTFVETHPVASALLLGLGLRIVAATLGAGFHARDDYFHVLEPALKWLQNPSYDWDHSADPGAGIRSHLVPRAIWLLLILARALHIQTPEATLQFLSLVAAAYSLLVIPAMYFTASRLLSPRGTLLATLLAAGHFAMPYAGTRLLIEAMAMPPLLAGVGLATFASTRKQFMAGLLIGLACWFRFQTGAAAAGVAVAVFLTAWRRGDRRGAWAQTLALASGGALAVVMQGLFDLGTTGDFLGPVLRNIAVNVHPDPGLSRSSAFTYLGTLLLLTLPPLSVVLLPPMVVAAKRLPQITWPFVGFVLLHSLVPHKEERFLLPILPLFLLFLAAVPETLASLSGRWWQRLQQLWRGVGPLTVGLHIAALVLATTNQSQANLRQAMVALHDDLGATGVVSLGPELQTYFLARPDIPAERASSPNAVFVGRLLRQENAAAFNRYLAFEPDQMKAQILLAGFGLDCRERARFEGWWFDRLLYRLNPNRNRRRTPVIVWECQGPAVAMSMPL